LATPRARPDCRRSIPAIRRPPSLGFVTDATKVSAAANPTYKAGQKCGTCSQFQGKAGDASGGCNIFAGKSVPAGGWCKVWSPKGLMIRCPSSSAVLELGWQAPALHV
jgi:hypothetical protein